MQDILNEQLERYYANVRGNYPAFKRELFEFFKYQVVPEKEFNHITFHITDDTPKELKVSLSKYFISLSIQSGFTVITEDQYWFNTPLSIQDEQHSILGSYDYDPSRKLFIVTYESSPGFQDKFKMQADTTRVVVGFINGKWEIGFPIENNGINVVHTDETDKIKNEILSKHVFGEKILYARP